MYVCIRLLAFFVDCPPSRSSRSLHVFLSADYYTRMTDQKFHRQQAQHKAVSSAQVALGIIKSLVAPNHGPLLSVPLTFGCIIL